MRAGKGGRPWIWASKAERRHGSFHESTDAGWDQALTTGFLSDVKLRRAVIPGMAERGWGRAEKVAATAT